MTKKCEKPSNMNERPSQTKGKTGKRREMSKKEIKKKNQKLKRIEEKRTKSDYQ